MCYGFENIIGDFYPVWHRWLGRGGGGGSGYIYSTSTHTSCTNTHPHINIHTHTHTLTNKYAIHRSIHLSVYL